MIRILFGLITLYIGLESIIYAATYIPMHRTEKNGVLVNIALIATIYMVIVITFSTLNVIFPF